MKKYFRVGIPVLIAVIAGAAVVFLVITSRGSYEATYAEALDASNKGDYKVALDLFEEAASQQNEKSKNFYADYAKAAYNAGDIKLAKSLARRANKVDRIDSNRASLGELNITIENILDDSLPAQLNTKQYEPIEKQEVEGLISG